jgi:hypothetical protein
MLPEKWALFTLDMFVPDKDTAFFNGLKFGPK